MFQPAQFDEILLKLGIPSVRKSISQLYIPYGTENIHYDYYRNAIQPIHYKIPEYNTKIFEYLEFFWVYCASRFAVQTTNQYSNLISTNRIQSNFQM